MLIRWLWWLIFGGWSDSECWYHADEIAETKVIPSPWEQRHPIHAGVPLEISEGKMELLPWLFTQIVVTIVRCKRCGRVKHIVTAERP